MKDVLAGVFGREIPLWPKDRSTGFKVGLYLAGAHLVLFVASTLDMVWHDGGRWHMFWMLCGYLDFPASVLLTDIILPVLFRNRLADPYMSSAIQTLMIFAMFYAFIGTAWYFWLPILIEKAGRKIATTRPTFCAVALLVLTPIFAHWLQLLRFAGGGSRLFVPGLYSILPVGWTLLFGWLLLATPTASLCEAKRGGRKAVLWLLLPAPFVYYYFVRDLYYYLTLARH